MIIAYVYIECFHAKNTITYMMDMHSYMNYRFDYVSEITGLEECFQHWPKLKELQ